jgi:hypothetical protein
LKLLNLLAIFILLVSPVAAQTITFNISGEVAKSSSSSGGGGGGGSWSSYYTKTSSAVTTVITNLTNSTNSTNVTPSVLSTLLANSTPMDADISLEIIPDTKESRFTIYTFLIPAIVLAFLFVGRNLYKKEPKEEEK